MPSYPTEIIRSLNGHSGPVIFATFTDDGNYCLTTGKDRTVKLWNPFREEEGKEREALHIQTYGGVHNHEVKGVAILPDNSQFCSFGGDKTAFLWDVTQGRVVRRFQGHAQHLTAACCAGAGDGRKGGAGTVLLTASYDRTVRAWDLRSRDRAPIQVIEDFKDSVTSVLATESEIITGCVDGAVRCFDLRAGEVRADHLGAGDPVTGVAISHDGNCLLASCLGSSSSDGTVQLLEKATGRRLASYAGHRHRDYALAAAFAHDDAHVLSGSEDGRVLIWDLVEQRVARALRHSDNENSGGGGGHSNKNSGGGGGGSSCVVAVGAHPKRPLALTAGYDGRCLLWGPPGGGGGGGVG